MCSSHFILEGPVCGISSPLCGLKAIYSSFSLVLPLLRSCSFVSCGCPTVSPGTPLPVVSFCTRGPFQWCSQLSAVPHVMRKRTHREKRDAAVLWRMVEDASSSGMRGVEWPKHLTAVLVVAGYGVVRISRVFLGCFLADLWSTVSWLGFVAWFVTWRSWTADPQ